MNINNLWRRKSKPEEIEVQTADETQDTSENPGSSDTDIKTDISGTADETLSGADSCAGNPAPIKEKPIFELHVTGDNMRCILAIRPATPGAMTVYDTQELYDEIVSGIQEKAITYGIRNRAIKEYCAGGDFSHDIVCAQGIEAIHEISPEMTYHFDRENEIRLEEKEDGSVDFRDLGIIRSVKKGDVLCSITPPESGKDGMTIYSQAVFCKKAALPEFPKGNNTVVSEDGLTLLSAIDGCIEYRRNTLNVNDVLVVQGDVDNSSGNIHFGGSVIVKGDVRESFIVKAGKDISVKGMVESAKLEAGGNIQISNGMSGLGKGSIDAGGNVVGKYFENVIINSGGNVYADVLIHSQVTAKGAIILKGKNGQMIGGNYEAGTFIYANTIGNDKHIRTKVSIESQKLNKFLAGETNPEVLRQRLRHAVSERDSLAAEINEIALSASKDSKDIKLLLKLREEVTRKNQLDSLIEQLEASIAEIEGDQCVLADFRIIGLKTVYAETKLSIGQFAQSLDSDYSCTKFYLDKDGLVVTQVLPSDRLSL